MTHQAGVGEASHVHCVSEQRCEGELGEIQNGVACGPWRELDWRHDNDEGEKAEVNSGKRPGPAGSVG